jgi:mitochondrial chaperone BCS1
VINIVIHQKDRRRRELLEREREEQERKDRRLREEEDDRRDRERRREEDRKTEREREAKPVSAAPSSVVAVATKEEPEQTKDTWIVADATATSSAAA